MAASEIKFGIEHEFFMLRETDDHVPTLSEINRFFDHVCQSHSGFGQIHCRGCFTDVELEISGHVVCISCEAFTHVVELTFPPLDSVEEFAFLIETALILVDRSARYTGLKRLASSSLSTDFQNVIRCNSRTDHNGDRVSGLLGLPDSGRPFYHRAALRSVAATQMSVDLHPFADYVKNLYSVEMFIPRYFSNSKEMLGASGHCLRPLYLWDYFKGLEIWTGIPQDI
ncbi:hypothetical protein [Neorhodopirellula lusitana]|uniref:hypothetical protein n=1 Tax=Neorhodopirellula lusitana TaxID=445327 RepID=UPI0038509355